MEQEFDVKQWRKAQRAELIARREAVDSGRRHQWNETMTTLIEEGFPLLSEMVVGFCWPYKAEFDPRFAMRYFRSRGAVTALPAVVDKRGPLQFRKWWPGAPMTPGVYGIPVPEGTEVVVLDAAIVPMNGFDNAGYRLGYGGGYFDRTLASIDPKPIAIGVAYELARLATLYPQPHDIPMDFVVTEAGLYAREEGQLVPVAPAECVRRARQLAARRGLPRRGQAVEAREGYASPPCYAYDFPGYFGEEPGMSREALVQFLNMLLEAERAGAKVLAAYLEDYPEGGAARERLKAVQRDEARNCAILMDLVRALEASPSPATGDFLGKALAVKGQRPRLEFLNRGQAWVARKLREALPKIQDSAQYEALREMLQSHEENIRACEALIQTLG